MPVRERALTRVRAQVVAQPLTWAAMWRSELSE
jgi:hypothetical protein